MRMPALAALILTLLAGCGGSSPPTAPAAATATPQEAQARVGDVTVHATVVQTSTLDDAVARQYGLERSDRVAMLLVGARRDGDAPLPSSLAIEARVADVTGSGAKPVALRRVVADGLVDYVGTVDIAPPETLRFDVVVHYGTATSTLQLTRDFYPR